VKGEEGKPRESGREVYLEEKKRKKIIGDAVKQYLGIKKDRFRR